MLVKQLRRNLLDRKTMMYQELGRDSDGNLRHTSHMGYVSLMPLMFGLIEDPTVLKNTLDFIKDEGAIWSDFGLRSLSKQDQYFHKGDDYWRGNIWINENYLVLRGIHRYYFDDPYAR